METQSSTSARPLDLHAICRLCLSDKNDSLKSIFDEILGPNRVPQKIELLIQIQISKHDKLSTMVCNDCIIRLDTWFAYKRQCHRNQTKLAEWLNISRTSESGIHEVSVQIKQEPGEPTDNGLLPVKVEMNHDDEEYGSTNVGLSAMCPAIDNDDNMYLEDLDINALETDDDRRCPDCGKMFGSAQNRRRHQNMMHAKKERRAQMLEISKPFIKAPSKSENGNDLKQEKAELMDLEPSTSAAEAAADATCQLKNENSSDPPIVENGEKISTSETDTPDNKDESSKETPDKMDTSSDDPAKVSDTSTTSPTKDHASTLVKEDPESSSQIEVKPNENSEEDKPETKVDVKSAEETQEDEKKILFAAGLRLFQKDAAPTELEALSKIELSYVEKCKAMVSMFQTLQCACHNVQHKSLRTLLSHLRETRIWFPLFTCYNCMISLTDRSTFTRHHSRCPRPQLETLVKLSNLRKRSDVKPRLYQNFKCNRCKFMYSFHDDYCKHVDEDHAHGTPPFYCSCRYVFDSLDEYKTHCYTSCMLSYYCDICFITTTTIEEFVKHAQEIHDNSEGFVLLQENTYVRRSQMIRHKEADDEANVVEGKRERRKSSKEPIMVQIYDREIPPDLKEIPTRVIKKMLSGTIPTSTDGWNKSSSQCPLCKKQYSSINNMMRHYRTHIERREVELPKPDDESGNEDLYTCPDCGGVYPSSKWQKHLEEHASKTCSECDKEFQFQSELEQHRSVHLNLKVFRDSKTHAYRSEMVSPTEESNEVPGDVLVMCDICDSMFSGKEELKQHKLLEHDSGSKSGTSSAMGNFEASLDGDQLSAADTLDEGSNFENETVTSQASQTSKSSDPDKPFCDQCNKPFASSKSLREHVINKHGVAFLKKNDYPKKCPYCEKRCATGAGYRIHVDMHERMNQSAKVKSEFPKQCEYCDKICTTAGSYYMHTQMHERVTLNEFNSTEDVKDLLEVKIKVEEDEESYHTCKRCFKVFGTKGKLKEHMKCHGINVKSSKKSRKVLCDLCHVALENREALARHKAEEHSEELDGMPTLTSEMDVDEDSQDTDNTDVTPGVIYACDVCEHTFSSKPELRTHKEIHYKTKIKNPALYCKYCKVFFESVNELTKHLHLEHNESAKPKVFKGYKGKGKDDSNKAFKCPICGKGFATLGAMTTHTGWHKRGSSNIQQVKNTPKADAAAKLAKREKAIKKIAAAAACKQEPVDIPEFQCSTCFMELPNDTALQIHVLEKHGNLDALMLVPRCDTCNQDFTSQEEYETHKRFHVFLERQKRHEQGQGMQTPIIQSVQSVLEPAQPSPKKFPCNWCNSVFSRHDTLNTHIKNHHREHVKTEFECHHCNRIFDKQNSLTIHLKVHQKQRNAAAAAAAVGNSGNVSMGSNGKVYVCSLCSMGFSFPKDLRMHTINAHPF